LGFFSNFTDFSLFLYFSDTAPVFSLPRYNVSIPDYSSVDSSVIAFYFTDSDYSDFYVDYQPEYDNDALFYLDTQSRKFIYRSGEVTVYSSVITLFYWLWLLRLLCGLSTRIWQRCIILLRYSVS
jgi:hypothetical protein